MKNTFKCKATLAEEDDGLLVETKNLGKVFNPKSHIGITVFDGTTSATSHLSRKQTRRLIRVLQSTL